MRIDPIEQFTAQELNVHRLPLVGHGRAQSSRPHGG
jgi:hypothetical protein